MSFATPVAVRIRIVLDVPPVREPAAADPILLCASALLGGVRRARELHEEAGQGAQRAAAVLCAQRRDARIATDGVHAVHPLTQAGCTLVAVQPAA
jgi:hypothetical protein